MALPLFGSESLYRYKDTDPEGKVAKFFEVENASPEQLTKLAESFLASKLDVVQFIGSKIEPILYKYHGNGWFKQLDWQPFASKELLRRIRGALYVPVDKDGNISIAGQPFRGIQTKASYDEGNESGLNMPNELRFQHFLKARRPIRNLYDLGFYEAGISLFGEQDIEVGLVEE